MIVIVGGVIVRVCFGVIVVLGVVGFGRVIVLALLKWL